MVEGCFCPAGLLLEGGKCVQKKECPCRLRNKSFPPGSVLKKDCNTCSCEGGEWICTKIPCGARCRAVGDPHYTTFDGLRYDFMGHCTYTMLQAENLTVLVENVACSGSITEGKPSCTKAVTLNYGGASIHLKQGGSIFANGNEITSLPGLCGTFNLNQKDDFLTPEGDIEQSTLAFANKWKTREFCSDESVAEPEHPVSLARGRGAVLRVVRVQHVRVPGRRVALFVSYSVHCRLTCHWHVDVEPYYESCVYDMCACQGDASRSCHWHVDVEPYYESCVYDMCACQGDASRCLCPILGDYAMSCAKAGVMLQWRYNVKECELSCTGGQEYTVCADSCLRKCSDSALSSATCEPRCVEGCACPQGQNYPPAEDLRSNCSATPNMEFTTCAKTEHLTCKNVPCGTTGATCSKSITLKVGSGNDEEIVSLTRNAPIPDISKLKR
ncbi:Hemocytin [Operophtera brumata]|uniref:Hemocytin n=1 Tax=Operophtera brumata TaxID=104452 RepID=A0A0L7LGX4_OPEBR|nr:Hemocytin [Operophtera brumata]